MSAALAAVVLATMCAPHALRLEAAPPRVGAVIWLAALALRALVAAFGAILIVLYLPTSAAFAATTDWCWRLAGTPVTLTGRAVGDIVLTTPAIVLAASALAGAAGLWRAARHVRALVRRGVGGTGPADRVLIPDAEVLVAAAGLRHPRVVVSAGALLALDDAELAASLAHERGHIAGGHRYVLVLAEMCRALARVLPGTRCAARELLFHLERDADRYALSHRHDPAVLASAICKAAAGATIQMPASGLAGGLVSRRVRLLLSDDARARATRRLSLGALATAMVLLVVLSATALPSAAHAGYDEAGHVAALPHCTD